MKRGLVVGAVALAVALGSSAAPAASPAEAMAEMLFQQAREDMRDGAFAQAYPKLMESERIVPSSGTLLNLMVCEEQLGRIASAWQHGRELLDRLDGGDDRRAMVARHVAALRTKVPTLVVRLAPGAPATARVTLDGAALDRANLGVPLALDPGTHRIVVSVDERRDRVESIQVEEEGYYERVLEPTPAIPADPAATGSLASGAPPGGASADGATSAEAVARERAADIVAGRAASRASTRRTAGRVALVAGVGGIVGGVILGALAFARAQTVRADCPGKVCTSNAGLEAASEGRLFSAGAVDALAVGAVGTGLGVYFLTGPGNATPRGAGAPVAQAASPGGMVIRCSGTF